MGLIQLLTHNIFSATYKGLGVYPGFGWDSIQDFYTDLADMAKNIQRDPRPSKVEAGPHMLKSLKKWWLSEYKPLSKALSFS